LISLSLTAAALADMSTSAGAIYGYEVLIGIGSGCGMQAGFAVIQTIPTPELMSHGLGFIMIGTLETHISITVC